jgi:hypothetical protein
MSRHFAASALAAHDVLVAPARDLSGPAEHGPQVAQALADPHGGGLVGGTGEVCHAGLDGVGGGRMSAGAQGLGQALAQVGQWRLVVVQPVPAGEAVAGGELDGRVMGRRPGQAVLAAVQPPLDGTHGGTGRVSLNLQHGAHGGALRALDANDGPFPLSGEFGGGVMTAFAHCLGDGRPKVLHLLDLSGLNGGRSKRDHG